MDAKPLRILTDDPGLERAAAELHEALSELIRVYAFRDRDRICCFDVSVSQCHALEAIVRRQGPTLNELAAELILDKSTASRLVDGLEGKGYVVRARDPRDRRAVRLEATSDGRDLLERVRATILAEERELLAGLEGEVRQALPGLIRRLARAAADRIDTSGGSCCRIA